MRAERAKSGHRLHPAICRSGVPELGVVVSPGPPPEQVLRDLSRAPPEHAGSALKAVLRILAHLSSRPAARLQLAYLEVYNDTINDLLPRKKKFLASLCLKLRFPFFIKT